MFTNVFRWCVPVLLVAGGLAYIRMTADPPTAAEPIAPERNEPWTVAPRYDLDVVATDEQLAAVLDRLRLPVSEVNTNKIVHALRLWGDKANFGDDAFLDGDKMRDYFLDDAVFRQIAGEDEPPLFTIRDGEVAVRAWHPDDPHRATSSVHVDDLLATLAEIGTPLDTPMITRDGETTVRALAESAMRRFHRQQTEYEWSIISYARYLFPEKKWTNRYGQLLTPDQLVDELIELPLRHGVCRGTHRIEALVVLQQVNEQTPGLSRSSQYRLMSHLARVRNLLVESQHPSGYWYRNWSAGARATHSAADDLSERILATGHHLEWLALAPPEVQPPRETIIRASQWLVNAMLEVDEARLNLDYGPFSHAARALCLWRSKDPYEAWLSGRLTPDS
ncbi:MAG: hypothetical protein MI757_08990 [Pirellulales bacterium]|nr:hypothetical protein [Pirellulales bacterium]